MGNNLNFNAFSSCTKETIVVGSNKFYIQSKLTEGYHSTFEFKVYYPSFNS
jgi:hypothetical protein